MEIIIELPKDINKLCRTCMNIVEDDQRNCVIDDVSGQKSELNEMLLHIIDTNVLSEECLPKFMCNECLEKLEIAYLFKQQCQSTYLHFRDFMYSPEKLNSEVENTNNFICATCKGSFSTQYCLSKHEVTHYKQLTLFHRFQYDNKEDINADLSSDNTEEISSLVSDRKQQISTMIDNKHRSMNFDQNVSSKTAQHEEIQMPNKVRACDLCGRTFNTKLSLHLHFVNHAVLAESDTDPDIFNQYFFCRSCGETFSCCKELENHEVGCSTFREFKCITCNQVFNSELNLLRHERELSHSDSLWEKANSESIKTIYICPICEDVFTMKTELHLHSVRHIIKKITCRICKKTFSCEVAHNNHLKTHPNYKHMCDMCGRWLGSRHALKTHIMGIHSSTRNFVCTICSRAFKTPSRLYIHKLIHKKDKKFVCSICSYKTNYVGDFKVHSRIHTSERPYKCNFVNCKRQFKTSSHLNEHIQRHLQIKKYQCKICSMVFGHSHTLKMHLMVHSGEKPFSCNICKVKFRRKHHLKNHMKQHGNMESEANEKML